MNTIARRHQVYWFCYKHVIQHRYSGRNIAFFLRPCWRAESTIFILLQGKQSGGNIQYLSRDSRMQRSPFYVDGELGKHTSHFAFDDMVHIFMVYDNVCYTIIGMFGCCVRTRQTDYQIVHVVNASSLLTDGERSHQVGGSENAIVTFGHVISLACHFRRTAMLALLHQRAIFGIHDPRLHVLHFRALVGFVSPVERYRQGSVSFDIMHVVVATSQ